MMRQTFPFDYKGVEGTVVVQRRTDRYTPAGLYRVLLVTGDLNDRRTAFDLRVYAESVKDAAVAALKRRVDASLAASSTS